MKKAVLFWFGAALMVSALSCGLKPGAIDIRLEPPATKAQTFTLGMFDVTWDQAGGGALRVTHQADPDKILWASLPGQGFAAAGMGQETIREARGSFFIKDRLQTVCRVQTVESIRQENDHVMISGRLSTADGKNAVGYTLTFTEQSIGQLGFSLTLDDPGFNRVWLDYATNSDEHFYGFGEQFTRFDLKGKRVPIFVMEQGIGRGLQPITFFADLTADSGGDWYTSYACVPHYITNQLRSLFLENYEYSIFDLRDPGQVEIEVFAPQMTGRIIYGESPAQLIEEYTFYAGRMRRLPDWILEGAVLGLQGGTARVKKIYDTLRTYHFPIAALWLQDWVGARTTSFGKQLWWNWTLDEERYPKRQASIDSLAKDGVRVMAYVNPFLVDVSERGKAGGRNLFKEAEEKGYLVRTPEDEPYMIPNTSFSAGLIDLSNPRAREWMKDVIQKEMVAKGAMGWMADFGEALPMDARLYSDESTATFHNRYPEEWARLNREAIEELPNSEEYVFFTRSGYLRSPRYTTLFWLGDQLVTWDKYDGIKSAVTGMLSSGLSGFSLNHSDIGGYTTISHWLKDYHRSKELHERWMELNAMSVVYRSHEGNIPEANDQIYSDEASMAHFARCAKIYKAWEDYRKQLVAEAAATGLPVVRHPLIHYWTDPTILHMTYEQFMVGADFMVAPVLDPGKNRVNVYLPEGKWVHLWTGKVFDAADYGARVSVPAPVGQPAVFFKHGSAAGRQFVRNLKQMGLL